MWRLIRSGHGQCFAESAQRVDQFLGTIETLERIDAQTTRRHGMKVDLKCHLQPVDGAGRAAIWPEMYLCLGQVQLGPPKHALLAADQHVARIVPYALFDVDVGQLGWSGASSTARAYAACASA